MCGIAGYVGSNKEFNSSDFISYVHKSLAYRGYDSFGMLGVNQDGVPAILKRIGHVPLFFPPHIDIQQILYHTRWATHGTVCKENTHPISSYHGTVHVVHNGIVTNADTYRRILERFPFVTSTDTEVLATYIELATFQLTAYENDNGFVYIDYAQLKRHLQELTGDFSFVARVGTQYICFARNMPLYVSPDGYISSDYDTILHFTPAFGQIPNDTIITWNAINKGWSGEPILFSIHDQSVVRAESYDHTMLTEILSQDKVPELVYQCDFELDRTKSLLLFGCGSSYYAGLLGRKYLQRRYGRALWQVGVEYASEITSDIVTPYSSLMGITQSGETKDTIGVFNKYITTSRSTSVLTNTPNSYITGLTNKVYNINVGKESAVASTKTFLGFCLWFYLQDKYLDHANPLAMECKMEEFRDQIREILENYQKFETLGQYNNCEFIVLGTGYNYPIALEGALKIKEVANCWADAMPAAEIKHGPISLIDPDTVAIVLMSEDRKKSINANIEQIKARDGQVLVLDTGEHFSLSANRITVPDAEPELTPLLYVICLQLMSYYLALAKGLNPDQPRHLSKAITV